MAAEVEVLERRWVGACGEHVAQQVHPHEALGEVDIEALELLFDGLTQLAELS